MVLQINKAITEAVQAQPSDVSLFTITITNLFSSFPTGVASFTQDVLLDVLVRRQALGMEKFHGISITGRSKGAETQIEIKKESWTLIQFDDIAKHVEKVAKRCISKKQVNAITSGVSQSNDTIMDPIDRIPNVLLPEDNDFTCIPMKFLRGSIRHLCTRIKCMKQTNNQYLSSIVRLEEENDSLLKLNDNLKVRSSLS